MEYKPVNESYFLIKGNYKELKNLYNIFKTEKETYGKQYGKFVRKKVPYYHTRFVNNESLMLPIGFLSLDYFKEFVEIKEEKNFEEKLNNLKMRNYQFEAFNYALNNEKCLIVSPTGSGKSLIIGNLIEHFKDLRGAIIVPNINLVEQFYNDLISYGVNVENISKLGGKNKLSKSRIYISTWQSADKLEFKDFDFIICDEVHKFSSENLTKKIRSGINAKYKIGFTGTLPSDKTLKMRLIGTFGKQFKTITTDKMINAGIGSPIEIKCLKQKYPYNAEFNGNYLDLLKNVVFNNKRNNFICNLVNRIIQDKNHGTVLILHTLIEHGKELFEGIKYDNKFLINGEVSGDERERIRQIADKENTVIVANYAILSTGVNMRNIKHIIFASPLKSEISIIQSIGRGIRVFENKNDCKVYDIVDIFDDCKIFYRGFLQRKKIYSSALFEYKEIDVNFFK